MAHPVPASTHTVRRLWPSDRAAVLDYFLRLDPDTRANRFMGTVSEPGVRAYAERAMTAQGAIFGGFVDGALRGVGELRPVGPVRSAFLLGDHAEAAFAVERAYRHRGIGADLFRRIMGAARHRGVVDLHVRCLARNGPMIRLARRLGADVTHDGVEAEGELHLTRATPFSFWHEGIAEAFDFTLAAVQPRREPVSA